MIRGDCGSIGRTAAYPTAWAIVNHKPGGESMVDIKVLEEELVRK